MLYGNIIERVKIIFKSKFDEIISKIMALRCKDKESIPHQTLCYSTKKKYISKLKILKNEYLMYFYH